MGTSQSRAGAAAARTEAEQQPPKGTARTSRTRSLPASVSAQTLLADQRNLIADGYYDSPNTLPSDLTDYLTDSAAAPDLLGGEFPHSWKRGDLLGVGASGRVFLVLNEMNGALMAAKQIPLSIAAGGREAPELLASLESEIALMSRLRHTNIVRYIGSQLTTAEDDASAGEKLFTILMEYIPGGSIASLVRRFGPLGEQLVRIYTRQILMGLAYLHAHAVVHRDIKGANALLDRGGVVKLTDFGASRDLLDKVTNAQHQSLRGTPSFMAPEVIRQTGYGRKSDIWSVGATVIEMATGRPPFSQYDNPMAAMYAIATSEVAPSLPEAYSAEAVHFVSLCFQRDPRARPTAAQLLRHPWVAEAASAASNSAGADATDESSGGGTPLSQLAVNQLGVSTGESAPAVDAAHHHFHHRGGQGGTSSSASAASSSSASSSASSSSSSSAYATAEESGDIALMSERPGMHKATRSTHTRGHGGVRHIHTGTAVATRSHPLLVSSSSASEVPAGHTRLTSTAAAAPPPSAVQGAPSVAGPAANVPFVGRTTAAQSSPAILNLATPRLDRAEAGRSAPAPVSTASGSSSGGPVIRPARLSLHGDGTDSPFTLSSSDSASSAAAVAAHDGGRYSSSSSGSMRARDVPSAAQFSAGLPGYSDAKDTPTAPALPEIAVRRVRASSSLHAAGAASVSGGGSDSNRVVTPAATAPILPTHVLHRASAASELPNLPSSPALSAPLYVRKRSAAVAMSISVGGGGTEEGRGASASFAHLTPSPPPSTVSLSSRGGGGGGALQSTDDSTLSPSVAADRMPPPSTSTSVAAGGTAAMIAERQRQLRVRASPEGISSSVSPTKGDSSPAVEFIAGVPARSSPAPGAVSVTSSTTRARPSNDPELLLHRAMSSPLPAAPTATATAGGSTTASSSAGGIPQSQPPVSRENSSGGLPFPGLKLVPLAPGSVPLSPRKGQTQHLQLPPGSSDRAPSSAALSLPAVLAPHASSSAMAAAAGIAAGASPAMSSPAAFAHTLSPRHHLPALYQRGGAGASTNQVQAQQHARRFFPPASPDGQYALSFSSSGDGAGVGSFTSTHAGDSRRRIDAEAASESPAAVYDDYDLPAGLTIGRHPESPPHALPVFLPALQGSRKASTGVDRTPPHLPLLVPPLPNLEDSPHQSSINSSSGASASRVASSTGQKSNSGGRLMSSGSPVAADVSLTSPQAATAQTQSYAPPSSSSSSGTVAPAAGAVTAAAVPSGSYQQLPGSRKGSVRHRASHVSDSMFEGASSSVYPYAVDGASSGAPYAVPSSRQQGATFIGSGSSSRTASAETPHPALLMTVLQQAAASPSSLLQQQRSSGSGGGSVGVTLTLPSHTDAGSPHANSEKINTSNPRFHDEGASVASSAPSSSVFSGGGATPSSQASPEAFSSTRAGRFAAASHTSSAGDVVGSSSSGRTAAAASGRDHGGSSSIGHHVASPSHAVPFYSADSATPGGGPSSSTKVHSFYDVVDSFSSRGGGIESSLAGSSPPRPHQRTEHRTQITTATEHRAPTAQNSRSAVSSPSLLSTAHHHHIYHSQQQPQQQQAHPLPEGELGASLIVGNYFNLGGSGRGQGRPLSPSSRGAGPSPLTAYASSPPLTGAQRSVEWEGEGRGRGSVSGSFCSNVAAPPGVELTSASPGRLSRLSLGGWDASAFPDVVVSSPQQQQQQRETNKRVISSQYRSGVIELRRASSVSPSLGDTQALTAVTSVAAGTALSSPSSAATTQFQPVLVSPPSAPSSLRHHPAQHRVHLEVGGGVGGESSSGSSGSSAPLPPRSPLSPQGSATTATSPSRGSSRLSGNRESLMSMSADVNAYLQQQQQQGEHPLVHQASSFSVMQSPSLSASQQQPSPPGANYSSSAAGSPGSHSRAAPQQQPSQQQPQPQPFVKRRFSQLRRGGGGSSSGGSSGGYAEFVGTSAGNLTGRGGGNAYDGSVPSSYGSDASGVLDGLFSNVNELRARSSFSSQQQQQQQQQQMPVHQQQRSPSGLPYIHTPPSPTSALTSPTTSSMHHQQQQQSSMQQHQHQLSPSRRHGSNQVTGGGGGGVYSHAAVHSATPLAYDTPHEERMEGGSPESRRTRLLLQQRTAALRYSEQTVSSGGGAVTIRVSGSDTSTASPGGSNATQTRPNYRRDRSVSEQMMGHGHLIAPATDEMGGRAAVAAAAAPAPAPGYSFHFDSATRDASLAFGSGTPHLRGDNRSSAPRSAGPASFSPSSVSPPSPGFGSTPAATAAAAIELERSSRSQQQQQQNNSLLYGLQSGPPPPRRSGVPSTVYSVAESSDPNFSSGGRTASFDVRADDDDGSAQQMHARQYHPHQHPSFSPSQSPSTYIYATSDHPSRARASATQSASGAERPLLRGGAPKTAAAAAVSSGAATAPTEHYTGASRLLLMPPPQAGFPRLRSLSESRADRPGGAKAMSAEPQ